MDIELKAADAAISDKAAGKTVEAELTRLFPRRRISRILLVAPVDVDIALFDYATAKRGRYWNYPPYGLGLIATLLKNIGLTVEMINLNHEVLKACRLSDSEESFDFEATWKNALQDKIARFQPDMVTLTCMFTQTHKAAVAVCKEVKRIKADLPLAVGGVHITNCFSEDKSCGLLLRDFNNADLFFLHEAEYAFLDFIRAVNRQVPMDRLHQVYFNFSREKFNFSRKEIPSEGRLNIIPQHELMDTASLVDYGMISSFRCFIKDRARIATVLANRGCRGQCTYCSVKNFNGPGVRRRSVESIADELCLLKNKFNITHIMWLDDDLLSQEKNAIKLFNEIAQRKLGMTWDCTNGVIASSCTDEVIDAAVKSGCIGLTIGVESGNPGILKKIKKPGSVDIFLKAANVVRKYEQVVTRVFLMIGFPGETYRMIRDTFELALKMGLDWHNITILQPLPNTPLFKSISGDSSAGGFEFESIRYNSGPYGKIREKANKDNFCAQTSDPFKGRDPDSVPSRAELDDIWFYMNYHLNFARLNKENRPLKLRQQLAYLKQVTDLVAPEDPFPLYFYGYLQNRVLGKADTGLIRRLQKQLESSENHKKRFRDFNLAVDGLRTGYFSFAHF